MNKLLLVGAMSLAVSIGAPVAPALAKKAPPVAALDTDNDGTVDLNELNKSAEELFGKLETDNDGTIDRKEMQGRVTRKEFTAADPDNDGTLTKDEFLAMVAAMFKEADPDNDGTLDEQEFKSAKGKALLRVTR
ncbi:EF-hand domain-containing protein [Methylocystis sp. WRRC1]|uniref:EF-hand domain-containing protein n=1 Tax=unclassified Methylocystis TaxID=2625913 RepID=UPI0001F88869|nr:MULTISPECIES: EF-hand domain-containing protein [unclassified Methylocystis]MCC3247155.1 EF-hand domain-containing protein [Methylocystis sp. WRRC1]